MVFDFQEEYLTKELKKLKPKKILVQLPEGVKKEASRIKEIVEKLGIKIVFSGETAWGGCCIAVDEAKKNGCDLIVHFGHSEFMKINFPVLYVEIKDNFDLKNILEKSVGVLKGMKRLGLSVAVQHRHDLKRIIDFYEKNNFKVLLSKKAGHASFEGHIIGCDYSGLKKIESEVDCFVVVGNRFHSLGAGLSVKKPVFLLDVYNNEVSNMKNFTEKIIRERAISIDKFKMAENIGVIVESKLGQQFGNSKIIIEKLEKAQKNIFVIAMNEISPDKIFNFYNIEAFVELACPRIAIDDFSRYQKPILTFREALVAVGEKSWEEFLKEGVL